VKASIKAFVPNLLLFSDTLFFSCVYIIFIQILIYTTESIQDSVFFFVIQSR